MHRNAILSLIQNYRVCHLKEAKTIDRFLAFIESNPACFSRHLKSGHITGSAWLLNRASSAVLLTHHRKLNRWLQLGGHAEGCSDIRSVAMREAYEESGLQEIRVISEAIFDIDIHRIPEREDEQAHDHYDIRFVFQAIGSDKCSISDESHALSWVAVRNVKLRTEDESILRMQRKWLVERKRYNFLCSTAS